MPVYQIIGILILGIIAWGTICFFIGLVMQDKYDVDGFLAFLLTFITVPAIVLALGLF